MVRAILEGRKTQTRRVLNVERMQTRRGTSGRDGWTPGNVEDADWRRLAAQYWCPHGTAGETLWVRETWAPRASYRGRDPGLHALASGCFYRADYQDDDPLHDEIDRWRPSIHMPRRASRLTLRVTDVRVQRLQDISADDACAEGIHDDDLPPECIFESLWDSINGKRAPWASNPWVWAITFERVEASRG
jgi:hypothetical protein